MKLEPLAAFCRTLPGATEDIKWGNNLVFSVGGKMFCVFGIEKAGLQRVSFKVEDERFLEYTDRPEFMPAPYMARAKWVSLVAGGRVGMKELKECLRTSHALVLARLTRKAREAILRH